MSSMKESHGISSRKNNMAHKNHMTHKNDMAHKNNIAQMIQ